MLISSTSEIQKYVAVGQKLTFELVSPYVDHAEQLYIRPLVGDTLMDSINAHYNADPRTLTAPETALLPYLQKSIANLAVAGALNVLQVDISASGVNMSYTDTKRPAFQYMTDAAREDIAKIGFEAIEQMLAFLDANATDYASWTASDAYKAAKKFFVNTAAEFTVYYPIRNSRRTFIQLYPLLKKAEDFQLRDVLGLAYFTELKARILGGSLNADDNAIMDFIKAATVYYTMGYALQELAVEITDTGIILNSMKAVRENSRERVPASEGQVGLLATKAIEDGEAYARMLRNYLNANASAIHYPTYFADTSVYTTPELSDSVVKLSNTSTARHYGAF